MKNKIFSAWILCSILVSCSKDYIDIAPVSTINVNNFYKNAGDISNAVNGTYHALQLQHNYLFTFAEIPSDNTTGINAKQPFDDFTVQIVEPDVDEFWDASYAGIGRANTTLNRINDISMDKDLKDRSIGELEFLRALMYFNLIRIYGDVPLVLKEITSADEAYKFGREKVEVVYQQIINDLKEADQKLPISYSGSNIGRATKGAAKALLAKVYLTLHKFSDAKTKLEEVFDLNVYKLLPNYADLFKVANENSVESIFEVQYKKGGLGIGSPFANFFGPRNSGSAIVAIGGTSGFNAPTDDMEKAYEAGDLRKDASMASSFISPTTGRPVLTKYVKKYLDPPFQVRDNDNNWPVLRYADVLLMYAEVLNEVNLGPGANTSDTYKYINEVRKRAGLGALQDLTYETFKAAVAKERRVELAFENHRWFDLLRTGKALEVMNAHLAIRNIIVLPHQLLFPIPLEEILVNPSKMVQNPGYTK